MASFLRSALLPRSALRTVPRSSPNPLLSRPPILRRFQPLPHAARPYAQYSYNRFGRRSTPIGNIFQRWAARPTFYYEVGGLAAVIAGAYAYNLEIVPVSGRRRFNVIGPESEREMGEQMFNQLLQQYQGQILPQNHQSVRRVKKVLARLVDGLAKLESEGHTHQSPEDAAVTAVGAASGWKEGLDGWEINVIQSDEVNAFVLPGNKVFVFTGILPFMQDESGVASVLGHEIAHNVAHHAAERMSSTIIAIGLLWTISLAVTATLGGDGGISDFFGRLLLDLGFDKPRSRKQESEADYIGLQLMARSCYDPERALEFWERMKQADTTNVPQIISTHPSDDTRIAQLKEWMPKARLTYENSDCALTQAYSNDFSRAFAFKW